MGARGGTSPPTQISTDQLTLSQPFQMLFQIHEIRASQVQFEIHDTPIIKH
jgi:hypothetical protein